MLILLVESDRRMARHIEKALSASCRVVVVGEPDKAVQFSDTVRPDVVVVEMMLAGHSGMEFLYEFRSYPDWQNIPVFVYTSMRMSSQITDSNDWKLLNITEVLYKPDVSITRLAEKINSLQSANT